MNTRSETCQIGGIRQHFLESVQVTASAQECQIRSRQEGDLFERKSLKIPVELLWMFPQLYDIDPDIEPCMVVGLPAVCIIP